VQLAHEASLIHDDIIDGSVERRGEPTAAARETTAALVLGDHALTAAYRAAALSEDLGVVRLFARAVERTVAGERAQAAARGGRLELARYTEIALGKAGELFGCALAIGPVLSGTGDAERWFETGRRVGLLYQMLDDLLDYCPRAVTGKPTLGDYAQARWTWVLEGAPGVDFGQDARCAMRALFAAPAGAMSPMRCALRRLDNDIDAVRRDLDAAGASPLLHWLLERWRGVAHAAVQQEESAFHHHGRRSVSTVRDLAPTSSDDALQAFLARRSRSFAFAAAFMPQADRMRVARVYAYCRLTDDLADGDGAASCVDAAEERLDEWLARSRAAYDGSPSGVELVDCAMGEMAERRIPFAYAAELVEAMRSDLRFALFDNLSEVRRYTHRAAGVVGLWLARLFGVRDPWMLERAAALGHAMQLTNILRDVGEDLDRGRLYLPLDRLSAHGLSLGDLGAMRRGESAIRSGYRRLLEEMMALADADYRAALEAMPYLPAGFRRSAAVAASVYAGIHGAIRRNGYDTLRRRAYTSGAVKVALAAGALWRLRTASGHRPLLAMHTRPRRSGAA
jgi:phytoene synthase